MWILLVAKFVTMACRWQHICTFRSESKMALSTIEQSQQIEPFYIHSSTYTASFRFLGTTVLSCYSSNLQQVSSRLTLLLISQDILRSLSKTQRLLYNTLILFCIITYRHQQTITLNNDLFPSNFSARCRDYKAFFPKWRHCRITQLHRR